MPFLSTLAWHTTPPFSLGVTAINSLLIRQAYTPPFCTNHLIALRSQLRHNTYLHTDHRTTPMERQLEFSRTEVVTRMS